MLLVKWNKGLHVWLTLFQTMNDHNKYYWFKMTCSEKRNWHLPLLTISDAFNMSQWQWQQNNGNQSSDRSVMTVMWEQMTWPLRWPLTYLVIFFHSSLVFLTSLHSSLSLLHLYSFGYFLNIIMYIEYNNKIRSPIHSFDFLLFSCTLYFSLKPQNLAIKTSKLYTSSKDTCHLIGLKYTHNFNYALKYDKRMGSFLS